MTKGRTEAPMMFSVSMVFVALLIWRTMSRCFC